MNLKDWEELFEAAVKTVPAYPVTLYRVYATPKRLLKARRENFICSPGIALLFSFILGYFVYTYAAGRLKPGQTMFEGLPVSWLVFSVIFSVLVIALQRVLVRLLVRRTAPLDGNAKSLQADFAAFTYAYSAVLPVGAVMLALIHKHPLLSPEFVGGLYVVYAWALFNMIRARYQFSVLRSLVGVLLSFLAVFIVGGIGYALLIAPFRTAT